MIDWKEFPDSTRVWIYQADRFLTEEEASTLNQKAQEFIKEWASHGRDLLAHAEVFKNAFLVFFVDESRAGASGCSIDSSVRFVKQVQAELNVDFFNRLRVVVESDDGSRSMVTAGQDEIPENCNYFYDNTVTSKGSLQSSHLKPVKGSWLEGY